MIEIDGLTVVTPDGRRILDDVSFAVAEGEKAALGGPSGAGKTTLLRALVGQARPTAGRVRIAGETLTPETAPSIRRAMCYVPQSFAFFEDDTIEEFLLLPFRFRANRDRTPPDERVSALLERFQLPGDILSSRVADVSGGERQRVALVRALLLERRLLVLDEVTSALDEDNKDVVLAAILGASGLTVLGVTHDADWWAHSSPRVTMARGRVTSVERGGAES